MFQFYAINILVTPIIKISKCKQILKDVFVSVCRFKSFLYYCHLAASPSFGRPDSSGVAFRRRQLSALQTMELPQDGDKYDSLLILTVTAYNERDEKCK